mgnify:CR=1 FL=1
MNTWLIEIVDNGNIRYFESYSLLFKQMFATMNPDNAKPFYNKATAEHEMNKLHEELLPYQPRVIQKENAKQQ